MLTLVGQGGSVGGRLYNNMKKSYPKFWTGNGH